MRLGPFTCNMPPEVDAGHRHQLVLDAREKLTDRTASEGHGGVDRQHRRGFGGAVAFEDADAEFLEPQSRTGVASFSAPAIT
jgi:hypothetical protein